MTILYTLMEFGIVRITNCAATSRASPSRRSRRLKGAEHDDLILRKEYPQIPPKVEYSLSPRGRSLMPILDALCDGATKTGFREFPSLRVE